MKTLLAQVLPSKLSSKSGHCKSFLTHPHLELLHVVVESLGFSIPAAAAAARKIGFDLEKAAALAAAAVHVEA